MFVALIAIAGFLLGLRAGIELGYRRAAKRLGNQKSGGPLLRS